MAVVGAGPAGLATASTRPPKASRCWCFDCRAFGGQAGASARIENYLGFPTGISGMALMGRAYNQAQKFGAEMAIPTEVLGVEAANGACGSALLVEARGRRAGHRTRGRRRQWGALPPSRRRGARSLRGMEACTIGPRQLEGRLCVGRGGRARRRRQLGGAGDRVPGEPGRQGVAAWRAARACRRACRATSSIASTASPTSRC